MPELAPSLSRGQRQTAKARATFSESFTTPEEKSAFYRTMAEKANAGRVVLSADEAQALSEAYALLRRVVARHRKIADPPPDAKEAAAGSDPAAGEAA